MLPGSSLSGVIFNPKLVVTAVSEPRDGADTPKKRNLLFATVATHLGQPSETLRGRPGSRIAYHSVMVRALALLLCSFACNPAGDAGALDEGAPDEGAPDAGTSEDAGDDELELLVESYLSNQRALDILADCPSAAAHRIPVLSIRYLPARGDVIDSAIAGTSQPVAVVRDTIEHLDRQLMQALEIGSTYHPAQDASAACSLNYDIVEQVEYLEALPIGPQLPGRDTHYPDYVAVLERENICDLVAALGVKEVWLWGYHHGPIEPAESNMSGPFGDISNSYRLDDMPNCGATYTLYNYNFTRGLGEALENHGHQIESMLDDLALELFRNEFVLEYGKVGGARNGCGNVHIPPNAELDYSWQEADVVQSDCADWNPQRTGQLSPVSCLTWAGCDNDAGARFKIWWMTHIPGRDNGLTHNGQAMRNWWDVVGEFDSVKSSGVGLAVP